MEVLDLFQYYIDTVYCFCYDDEEQSPEIYFITQIEDSTEETKKNFVDLLENQNFKTEEEIIDYIKNHKEEIIAKIY